MQIGCNTAQRIFNHKVGVHIHRCQEEQYTLRCITWCTQLHPKTTFPAASIQTSEPSDSRHHKVCIPNILMVCPVGTKERFCIANMYKCSSKQALCKPRLRPNGLSFDRPDVPTQLVHRGSSAGLCITISWGHDMHAHHTASCTKEHIEPTSKI